METAGLVAIIVIALFFDYTNGFHDAANAIATSVSTRALTPRVALAMAAVFNLAGAFVSTKVAKTVGSGIIGTPKGHEGLVLVFAALIGAITWNLITWYFGLPSSSSHALIGGLVGAALASTGHVHWGVLPNQGHLPDGAVAARRVRVVVSFHALAAVGVPPVPAGTAESRVQVRPDRVGAAMSYGHGLQDAQKTMGVITLALVTSGHLDSFHVPLWVIFAAAASISLGTYSGGWRIMRTLGRRVFKLDASGGFAAQTVASSISITVALGYAAPISTTHVISSSVMGVGATRRLSAVRWGVAGNIVTAWILTLPAAGLIAALAYEIAHAVVG